MPAKSQSQQRLFGMVRAYQTGKLKRAPQKVTETAAGISAEDARHFAATKHDTLPDRVEKTAEFAGGVMAYAVEKRLTPPQIAELMKTACDWFNLSLWGDTLEQSLIEKFALSGGPSKQLSAAPMTLPQLPQVKQAPGGASGQSTLPEPSPQEIAAATGPVKPTFNAANLPNSPHRYNFNLDPDIQLMLTRQKENLEKKKMDLQKEQEKHLLQTGGASAGPLAGIQQPQPGQAPGQTPGQPPAQPQPPAGVM